MSLAKDYARAIHEVRAEKKLGDQELMASVTAALKRRHHDKLLPQVLEELKRLAGSEKHDITIRGASEQEAHQGLSKLRDLGIEGNAGMVVDPKLVKGYVLEGKDFRYDASAKRALVDLYKRLTANA